MQNGEFSELWKLSTVKPLIKKPGMELQYGNYRPISNLSFLSKVIEKLVLQQYNHHIITHSLLPDYQSAYRQGYSCETALVKLFNDSLWSMEKKRVTTLCAIDLSAAFDTVDHDVLLTLLKNRFGISGNVFSWFRAYLRPRQFRVRVGETYSEPRAVDYSVPQGSVVGPQLFSAYASTLGDVVLSEHNISLYGFADDHVLSTEINLNDPLSERRSISSLEQCLNCVKEWTVTD